MLMIGPLTCPLSSLMKLENNVHIKCKILTTYNIIPITAIIAALTMSLIFSSFIISNEEIYRISNNAYAQVHPQNDSAPSANKITIQLNSIKFAPLTDTNYNQFKVLVDYQTNDPSSVNTTMIGTMKVYLPDGTPLNASFIQKGYIVGQSGIFQFATSFTDKTIQGVTADVYLTDTRESENVSNTITINASLAN